MECLGLRASCRYCSSVSFFRVTVASTLAVVITVIITKYHHSESDEFLNGHKGNHSHDNLRSTSSGDSDYNACYCLLLLFFEIRPLPLKEGLSACDFRVFRARALEIEP